MSRQESVCFHTHPQDASGIWLFPVLSYVRKVIILFYKYTLHDEFLSGILLYYCFSIPLKERELRCWSIIEQVQISQISSLLIFISSIWPLWPLIEIRLFHWNKKIMNHQPDKNANPGLSPGHQTQGMSVFGKYTSLSKHFLTAIEYILYLSSHTHHTHTLMNSHQAMKQALAQGHLL